MCNWDVHTPRLEFGNSHVVGLAEVNLCSKHLEARDISRMDTDSIGWARRVSESECSIIMNPLAHSFALHATVASDRLTSKILNF
jgi:hypothetical protein